MANKKHLTLDERIILLKHKASFQDIAVAIAKNSTSISREVRSHLIFRRKWHAFELKRLRTSI